jgi:hypothetical protein
VRAAGLGVHNMRGYSFFSATATIYLVHLLLVRHAGGSSRTV